MSMKVSADGSYAAKCHSMGVSSKRKEYANGGMIMGDMGGRRLDRPSSGKASTINIIVGAGGQSRPTPAPMPVPMPMPAQAPPLPAQRPAIPPAMAAAAQQAMAQQSQPPGLNTPMAGGMPPITPMMNKGGRVARAKGGRLGMEAGALSGEGRLQKSDIHKGKSPRSVTKGPLKGNQTG